MLNTIDCNAGYWQISMAEEDIPKTAFVCHSGVYKLLRNLFGFTNAQVTFQRATDMILSGERWKHSLVYLDDVIVFSKSLE